MQKERKKRAKKNIQKVNVFLCLTLASHLHISATFLSKIKRICIAKEQKLNVS